MVKGKKEASAVGSHVTTAHWDRNGGFVGILVFMISEFALLSFNSAASVLLFHSSESEVSLNLFNLKRLISWG